MKNFIRIVASILPVLCICTSCTDFTPLNNVPVVTTDEAIIQEPDETGMTDNWSIFFHGTVHELKYTRQAHAFFRISSSPDFNGTGTVTLISYAFDDETHIDPSMPMECSSFINTAKPGVTYYYVFGVTDGIAEATGEVKTITIPGSSPEPEPEPEPVAPQRYSFKARQYYTSSSGELQYDEIELYATLEGMADDALQTTLIIEDTELPEIRMNRDGNILFADSEDNNWWWLLNPNDDDNAGTRICCRENGNFEPDMLFDPEAGTLWDFNEDNQVNWRVEISDEKLHMTSETILYWGYCTLSEYTDAECDLSADIVFCIPDGTTFTYIGE